VTPAAAVPSAFLNDADTTVVSLNTNEVFVIVTEPFADDCDTDGIVPIGVVSAILPPLPPQADKDKHIIMELTIPTTLFIITPVYKYLLIKEGCELNFT
jgi:hypothetical protein